MFNVHFNFRSVLTSLAIVFLLTNFSLFFTTPVNAANGINKTINFQGKLVNNSGGTNLANGTYSMTFAFYNHPTLGTTTTGYLWKEVYTNSVTVTDGIFRVALGSQTAFPANFNFNWDGLYLGVTVGADSEMTPRIQMASVPFAFNAQQVDGLTIQDSAGVASTSATLKIGTSGGAPVTVNLGANNLTFTTTGTTTLALPAVTTGTVVVDTLQGDITGASKNITALAGLTINAAGKINSATAGMLTIGDTTTNQLILGGSNLSAGMTLAVGSGQDFTFQKNGLAFACTGTDKLTLNSSGQLRCATDQTGAGVTSPFVELGGVNGGLVYESNTTTDFLLGGQSTASARFRVTGNLPGAGTLVVASITGETSFATLAVNNDGLGDIFTASSSGVPLFTVRQNGGVVMAGNSSGISFTGTGINSITTAADQSFAINPAGQGLVGINTDGVTPRANFDVRANVGTIAIASVSGATSYAALTVDNSGTGDLITASTSGATKFVVRQNGSVGIGNGTPTVSAGYTLDVLGNARIGSSNTSGDDIYKATTSDFTQGTKCTGTNYCVSPAIDGADTVTTANNQLQLVTDLISAPGFTALTAPTNGTGTGQNIGAGAIAIQRPDSKFLIVAGGGTNVTRIYDPATNAFINSIPTMLNNGAGNLAFQRADGNFMIVMGGTNQSSIYYPAGAANAGTMRVGPVLTNTVGVGSQVMRRSDGKFLVLLGNGTPTTNLYDPTSPPMPPAPQGTDSGNFNNGPNLTGNVTTGSFAFETVNGTWIVGLGGNTVNTYNPVTGVFTAGPNLAGGATTGAGAHVIQRPDSKFLLVMGAGNAPTTTQVYDPVTNTWTNTSTPTLSGNVGAGAHSIQESNGNWVTFLGGGSAVTNLYDPINGGTYGGYTNVGTYDPDLTVAGNSVNTGGLSFQRPDGKYIIVSGGGLQTYTIYDGGWNTTGTWTSEAIATSKISTYSAVMWTGDPQSANNNARLDKSTTDVFVKTAASLGELTTNPSNKWNNVAASGGLIGGIANPAAAVQMQVTFNAPVRSYPQLVTSNINQSNVWTGEGGTFNRRTFLQPTIYSLRITDPLVQYGGLANDPAFGRNFATSGALLEGVVTDNNNQLTLAINRNLPTATISAGFIIASSSANLGALGVNVGAGANVIQIPNGQFILMVGGNSLLTKLYDPDSNTWTAGPALPAGCNSGCHSFQLPNGGFFTVLGGATKNTAIYDPASNTFYAGPTLVTSATTGSVSFQRPDGLFVILIGGSAVTNIYDPFLNQVFLGPYSSISPGVNFGAGTSTIMKSDGRVLILTSSTVTMTYDYVTNAFISNGTGETIAAAEAAGSAPFQLPSGRWYVPRGGGNNTGSYIDPILNTIAAAGTMATAANTGAFWIQRPDGKALLATGGSTSTTNIFDPQVDGGTQAMTAGPTLPCSVGAGTVAFQRPDGAYVLICGGSTNWGVIDAGWNLGGSYFSEQIYEPNLSANTGIFWQAANNQGNIYVKYRTAATQAALGMASWKTAPASGSQLSITTGDQWVQTRFDLQGSLPDMPGSMSRIWGASDTSSNTVYYRTVAAPTLASWKLMNSTTPTILTLTANGSNAFRFSADGQAYTSAGGAWNSGGADLAENYTSSQDLQPGEVVVGDKLNSQNVVRSTSPYQTNIMGVVSTKPGFVAGAYTPDSYPIALVGRVPLKISTENGPIYSGDYLTSASIPGYAMKATVAGRVLGTALQDFDPSDPTQVEDCPKDGAGSLTTTKCGTITAFINLTSYNGQNVELAMADAGFTGIASQSAGLSNIQANTGLNSYMNQVSVKDQNILSYIESLKDAGSAAFDSSEVFAGKVVAGEVISPNIVADLITAKTIRADHIEGLEILTNRISALEANTAVLSDATGSAQLATASAQLPSTLNLSSLNVDGLATVSGDLNVKGNGFFQGALNVLDSITTNNLLVSQFAYFINDVVFKGNVRFNGTPTFNNDTAGFAVIKQGQDTVQINFNQEYANTPVVTASIALDKVGDSVSQKQLEDAILSGNLSYVITQRTTKGFVIRLNKPAAEDLNFSWVALSVQNAKTSGLNIVVTPEPQATQSAAFQSILNQIETPTPTVAQ